MDPLVSRFRRRLPRRFAAGPDNGWVVAVSGGSDSVALLRLLHAVVPEFSLRLSVAHLDHGVRGEAARADADFVARLAGELGLPFDLGRWTPSRAGHFEADARRARYAWLLETARARGSQVVAVGHTRDDQAETILHRIVRGTGPRGLAGIRVRRRLGLGVSLVRPLLGFSREELRSYLGRIGQGFCDDATNADLSRTRARLRHDLLPRLERDYNPEVAAALVRLGALAGAAVHELEARWLEWLEAATLRVDDDSMTLDRQRLLEWSRFARAEVLRLAWRRMGWPEGAMGARRWRRLARLVEAKLGRWPVGAGVEAEVEELSFTLGRPAVAAVPSSPSPASVPLEIPGAADWDRGRIVATLDPDEACDERIDLDRLALPLLVRPAREGDRFEPLGMAGQGMPLNDFFRGRRVSRPDRSRVPLVCDREGIVWVAGHRIADRVRVTEQTRRLVGLRWEGQSQPPSRPPGDDPGCD